MSVFKPWPLFLTMSIVGEQEWIAIANMVLYHNAVGSATLMNVFIGTEQQVGMYLIAVLDG
jgi:hypothetical protein